MFARTEPEFSPDVSRDGGNCRGNAVPYYEFCLIGGDGSRLSRERHLAADLETVWGRVFRMAELESKRGKQIHVLDDQGRIVIGIGAIAATLSAQRTRAGRGRFHEA